VEQIFKDLKIIELAGVLAGPSVGYFFAELGAKVIKVENKLTNGDVTRSWKLKGENPNSETSAYYWSVNALKESVFLDLSKQPQLKQFYEQIKSTDVVITNYKLGDAEKLKVDYKTLSELKPDLIYASINGFGNASPRTAYDLILQAESGFMSINGETNSNGLKMPVALIDLLAGHQMKQAILIALIKRLQTKSGSHISVSLFDSAVASLVNQATNWLVAKQLPKPIGSIHPNIAPYGELFDTKDKHLITFAVGSNKQFQQLCELISFPSLAKDTKYSTNQQRVNNRQQLYSILYDYIKQFSFKELFKQCEKRDIPIGKIRNIKEVFELPEAKDMLLHFESDNNKLTTVKSVAFKFIDELTQ
jgi:crotonobetainyl-CoA:carnitine CoA-transferase CaiB-like acyl-CoA transferase